MPVFLIVLASLLWCASIAALYGRQLLAPALSYCAMVCVSMMRADGCKVLPLNSTVLTCWLVMTLGVMIVVLLQTEAVRRQTKGMTWLIGGAAAGLALGLLGFSSTQSIAALYAWMILGTAGGTALGFLLYTSTPDGRPVRPGSGRFLSYLLAKGFPTAITFMQLGVVLMLLIAMHNMNAL